MKKFYTMLFITKLVFTQIFLYKILGITMFFKCLKCGTIKYIGIKGNGISRRCLRCGNFLTEIETS